MSRKKPHSTVLFFHSHQRNRSPAEEKLSGIYRFARACEWNVVTVEPPESRAEVRGQIQIWKPLGCIVDMNESHKYFTASTLRGTPTVFLDFDNRQSQGKTFRVNHNPDAVALLAAKHLSSLGLAHFAFVGYTQEWSWSDVRKNLFHRHLGKSAESFSAFSFPVGTTVSARIRDGFMRWLSDLPRPCGILLADDGLANEIYPACDRLNIAIPEELAILGIDDNERLCRNMRPALSSILLDFSQAGWMAAELLHRQIANPSLQPFVLTYAPLGIAPRGSTALKVHRHNPLAEKAVKLIAELAPAGANAADIARRFTCSRRLLELRFRESTGQSLLEAIHDCRVKRAMELLQNRSLLIGAIAPKCGYASESALKAHFRRKTGVTMRDFRRSAAALNHSPSLRG